jgi:two-component system phosphate regulon sensor histidine kinase PhoR
MKLKPTTIRTIVATSTLALVGLVVLQYFMLRNAYEFRQQAFDRNVHAAMNAMARRLETGEAIGKVFQVAVDLPHTGAKMTFLRLESDSLRAGNWKESGDRLKGTVRITERAPLRIRNNTIEYSVTAPQHVTLRLFNLTRKKDTLLVDGFKEPGEYTVNCGEGVITSGETVVKYRADSSTYTLRAFDGSHEAGVEDAAVRERREEIVGRAIDNLSLMDREPIEKRLSPSLLDSVVGTSLKEAGIDLPYACGILSDGDDSLRMAKPSGYERELRSSEFRNPLFPEDLLFSKNQLALFFPGRSTYLLRQVGPMLGLTILFMGVVVACFVTTIRTIVRQKDFSLRLIDFINNMTHEFKTPISTIAVAVETIERPEVIGEKERVLRYTGVIHDENARMKNQVDKILQMAVLEEGDYDLKTVPVDVHAVIRNAVENIVLQVEAKGGTITSDLAAARPVVNADPVHLANIIHNILDNANKYSPQVPFITVGTSNNGASVLIEIRDNGIGIDREEREKVFEKYYRVQTGNIHDVKGFGLGLSYVKLMMEAQGGSVSISGGLGQGTCVLLTLPVMPDGDGGS